MAPITIEDELRLIKSNAKRVRNEATIVIQGVARTLERLEKQTNVQSQEDTTDHGTDIN